LSWNATPDRESGVLYATARDITNISKVHEENRRLSLVAKGTNNIVVITDKHRKIEWVNQAFETLTGYHLDEVIGLSPGSFLQFEETNVEVIKEIREALNNECAFNGEILNISKKGSKYWLELSISPVFNDKGELINFIAVESDVTEKKKKDSSIINLIETQNSIFNGVGHAVMFTNTFGIIQRINKAGLKLIGYTENEVIGRMNLLNFFDLSEVVKRSSELSVELGEKIEPGFNTFIAKTKGKSTVDANEWTYIAKDGKRIPVWMSITCIKNTDGAILGYFSAAEDYTTKKQVELDLIRAKDLAEQAAHAKDSFLANMSHEIRTPLNAIIGFTELLSQNNLDPTQRDYVNNINTAGDNLLLIINDILDISKIESGQLVIESNAINLKSTLKHVYDLLKVKADQKNLEFNLFLDADMPEFVMGDKGRINQIMMNLAGNSLKFTEKGEVTISVKKMRETENTITLRFSIKDTGIGIPEDKLGSIFERFTQAESSTTRKFGGTGLGLNIVKQLVELQNGQINVKSQFGHGSEFYFSLDLEKVENKEFEIINEIKKQENSLGNLSVLLCEDNLLNQHLAKKVMEKFGFELDIANNGKEGVDRLLLKDYDLILMDLQMPVMDGYQTTVYIRQILKRDIPIIAMTAHSLVGEQQKCFEIGMNAYVAKPFKQSELLDKIYSIIKKDDKKNDKRKIGNTKHIKEKRIMDFSYIDELSGGDEDFKKEIIKLFLEKVPEDIANLETAILNSDTIEIGKTTHHMKSSLSMFLLEKEVAFLVETEKDAKAAIICENLKHDFNTFKTEMNAVAEILKELV
jgi:PAS domain S-box-containing protein